MIDTNFNQTRMGRTNKKGNRYRRLSVESLEQRCVLSAGPLDASLAESGPPPAQVVEVEFITTDLDGNPIEQLAVGDSFLLSVRVQDVRTNPQGVFSLYMDLLYDSRLVDVSAIERSDTYAYSKTGDLGTSGRVNEVGSFSGSLAPLGGGSFPLYTLRLRALAEGTVRFAGEDATECGPATFIGVYGWDEAVHLESIDFGSASIQIGDGGAPEATIAELASAAPDNCRSVNHVPSQTISDPPSSPDAHDDYLSYTPTGYLPDASADYTNGIIYFNDEDWVTMSANDYSMSPSGQFSDLEPVRISEDAINLETDLRVSFHRNMTSDLSQVLWIYGNLEGTPVDESAPAPEQVIAIDPFGEIEDIPRLAIPVSYADATEDSKNDQSRSDDELIPVDAVFAEFDSLDSDLLL